METILMTDQPYPEKILELAEKWIDGSITEPEKRNSSTGTIDSTTANCCWRPGMRP